MRSSWPRRVIPRWRSSTTSASLAESLPHKPVNANVANRAVPAAVLDEARRKIEKWTENQDVGRAIDLLSLGVIEDLHKDLTAPAELVLSLGSDLVTPQLKRLADTILSKSHYHEYFAQQTYYRKGIARLRALLSINPRNSLAWVDIARIYTILGQNDPAKRAMKIALSLAPNNRFVLRSVARFLLHVGDPERALAILKRSPRTVDDPWLLASMISVETILSRDSQNFKKAKQLVDGSRFAPVHLAELGAAVATLHINSGESKLAKRAFNVALQNPNDNAVAQAVWVANEFSLSMNIMPEWLTDRFSAEANYYALEKAGDYRAALTAACTWFEDEPFSIRPLRAGAFAASILGKYQVAQDQMEQALTLDPHDIESKNNLVFALAGQDELERAFELLHENSHAEIAKSGGLSGHSLANWGMLYYRNGDLEKGGQLYKQAHAALISKNEKVAGAVALAYWAQEAKRALDPAAGAIIADAEKQIVGDSMAAAKVVLQRTIRGTDEAAPKVKVVLPSAISWVHDKDANTLTMNRALPFSKSTTKPAKTPG